MSLEPSSGDINTNNKQIHELTTGEGEGEGEGKTTTGEGEPTTGEGEPTTEEEEEDKGFNIFGIKVRPFFGGKRKHKKLSKKRNTKKRNSKKRNAKKRNTKKRNTKKTVRFSKRNSYKK